MAARRTKPSTGRVKSVPTKPSSTVPASKTLGAIGDSLLKQVVNAPEGTVTRILRIPAIGVGGKTGNTILVQSVPRTDEQVRSSEISWSPDAQLRTKAVVELAQSWAKAHTPTSQIQVVLALATEVFDDANVAEKWLKQPNLATNNAPPLALLGTQEGLRHVTNLLRRIEYGVLA